MKKHCLSLNRKISVSSILGTKIQTKLNALRQNYGAKHNDFFHQAINMNEKIPIRVIKKK